MMHRPRLPLLDRTPPATEAWWRDAWFLPGTLLLGGAVALETPLRIAAAIGLLLVLLACRGAWEVGITALGAALTLATATSLGIGQPTALRFVAAAGLVIVGSLLHPIRAPRAGRLRRVSALLAGFLALSAVGVLTTPFARTVIVSVPAATAVLGVPLVSALGRWRSTSLLRRDLVTLHRLVFVLTVIGLGAAIRGGFGTRASGIHANPNTLGYVALLAFALHLGLRSERSRWRDLTASVVPLTVVAATGSRGAIAGVLLSIAHLALRGGSRRRAVSTAGVAAALIGITLVMPVPAPLDIVAAIDRTFGSDRLDLSGRQEGWQVMVELWRERPVLGWGLRTTDEALNLPTQAYGRGGGHSSYLQTLVENGLLGALMLYGAILVALRTPPPRSSGPRRDCWIAASSTCVGGLGHMTGESFVLGIGGLFPLVFWSAVLALAALSVQGSVTEGAAERTRKLRPSSGLGSR